LVYYLYVNESLIGLANEINFTFLNDFIIKNNLFLETKIVNDNITIIWIETKNSDVNFNLKILEQIKNLINSFKKNNFDELR
jgi:hypothetical protein